MNWIALKNLTQIPEITTESKNQPVLILKHSTRCSISATALGRLERNWKTEAIKPYYLDLISFREISNELVNVFGIEHESPQVLLIHHGKCVYHASHLEINYNEILNEVQKHPIEKSVIA